MILEVKEKHMEWRLAEAKNKFSELINRALAEGPQRILRRGDAVIVIAWRDDEKLTGTKPGFKQFLMDVGPDLDGVNFSRDRSPMRESNL
jgi:prevent-host-death family protein